MRKISRGGEAVIISPEYLIIPVALLPKNPTFILNGFAAPENLGSPIYFVYDVEPMICAMIMTVFPEYMPKIQIEGIGISLDFILRTKKQKTGIDLRS